MYLDELFLFNWMMDLLVLMLADPFFRDAGGRRFGRLLCGAACGAAGSCMLSVLQYVCGYTWIAHGAAALFAGVLLAIGMTAAAFPIHTAGSFFLHTIAVYASALLIGGVCDWLRAYMGGNYLFCLTAATILCAACRLWLVRHKARVSTYISARVSCGGAVVCVKGMVDTGNSLTLPGTHIPVSVIWEKAILPALSDEQADAYRRLCAVLSGKQKSNAAHVCDAGLASDREKTDVWRLVPYQSVGCSLGFLPALCVPHVYVRTETQERHLEQVWLAVSPRPLSARGSCVMLWHPAHINAVEME